MEDAHSALHPSNMGANRSAGSGSRSFKRSARLKFREACWSAEEAILYDSRRWAANIMNRTTHGVHGDEGTMIKGRLISY